MRQLRALLIIWNDWNCQSICWELTGLDGIRQCVRLKEFLGHSSSMCAACINIHEKVIWQAILTIYKLNLKPQDITISKSKWLGISIIIYITCYIWTSLHILNPPPLFSTMDPPFFSAMDPPPFFSKGPLPLISPWADPGWGARYRLLLWLQEKKLKGGCNSKSYKNPGIDFCSGFRRNAQYRLV